VAKEFAAEVAQVFLASRTKSNVEEVTKQITAAGGIAQAAVIDALDDVAVGKYGKNGGNCTRTCQTDFCKSKGRERFHGAHWCGLDLPQHDSWRWSFRQRDR
jgi:hypothetical protein